MKGRKHHEGKGFGDHGRKSRHVGGPKQGMGGVGKQHVMGFKKMKTKRGKSPGGGGVL